MKNITVGILMMIPVILAQAGQPKNTIANRQDQPVKKSDPVEVYYVHMERRCATCQAVEEVTKTLLDEKYTEEIKSGKLVFRSVNFEEKANKPIIQKLKVSGQALLLVSKKERIDLTDKGFLYARTEPDKLKAALISNIDRLIK